MFHLQRDNLDCPAPRFSHYTFSYTWCTVSSFLTSVTFMKECTGKKTDVNRHVFSNVSSKFVVMMWTKKIKTRLRQTLASAKTRCICQRVVHWEMLSQINGRDETLWGLHFLLVKLNIHWAKPKNICFNSMCSWEWGHYWTGPPGMH